MTAVAAPPSFTNLNRPGWINGGSGLNSINPDERGASMFAPRKTMQRSNSSSSIASNSSSSSASTVTSTASGTSGKGVPVPGDLGGWAANGVPRKRPQPKGQWTGKQESQADFQRPPNGRPSMVNGLNGPSPIHQPNPMLQVQSQVLPQNGMTRPGAENMAPGRQAVLYLTSLNGTFERKTISVPYYPDTLRIGRQTNQKTVPTPQNGFFDSKVLSRQHAEIWADQNGKIFIRDVKSSNGTFVNNQRLSQENRESEPRELQANDRLELGIDIVSEDQKTVVHHKVAAKVEHAGFLAPSNSSPDMSFGDLDPSLGGMMMPVAGMPARGRYGSMMIPQLNGRVMPANIVAPTPNGMGQRQFWLHPPTVDNIVKRLHSEMRNARLQNQDLRRTQEFIDALLSHEDVKGQENLEVAEPLKNNAVNGSNGNALSFRSDGGKNRFSEPPAPPPSQPLPEKPDAVKSASDVPSLKRGTTERPKSNPPGGSPSRQDSSNLQLMEMLTNARREAETHSARVRDLEEMLIKEREARLFAEDMIQKMEETNHGKMNGTAIPPLANGVSELDKAFDPPAERPLTPEPDSVREEPGDSVSQPEKVEGSAAILQARMDSMLAEMKGLRDQLELYRQRAEQAEAERDTDRKTLAELVKEIQRRDEEERKRAERKTRSPSTGRSRPSSSGSQADKPETMANGSAMTETAKQSDGSIEESTAMADALSRSNTVTPSSAGALSKVPQDQVLLSALPYASMVGVVLIGMGLMAYLNGWQPQPRLDR